LDVSLDAIALAGPGPLRDALAGALDVAAGEARRAALAAGGEVGAALIGAASALERARLSSLTGGLDELLAALDPEPVAAEVDAACRSAVAAYDPAVLVDEIGNFLHSIAQAVRSLDPAAFLGDDDLAFLKTAVDRAEQAVPSKALEAVGQELDEAGKQLAAID